LPGNPFSKTRSIVAMQEPVLVPAEVANFKLMFSDRKSLKLRALRVLTGGALAPRISTGVGAHSSLHGKDFLSPPVGAITAFPQTRVKVAHHGPSRRADDRRSARNPRAMGVPRERKKGAKCPIADFRRIWPQPEPQV
jgi:hypothetical protein